MREFLNEAEAALKARVSPKYLKKLRCTGSGPPFIRVAGGRRIIYAASDVEAWLERDKVRSTSEASVRRMNAEAI